MRPVSPVIPTADLNEIVVAENQPEYQNLPAVHVGDGMLLTRWKADETERKRIAETGDIYVSMMTFGNPVMPLLLQAEPPAIPEEKLYIDDILESETIECDSERVTSTGAQLAVQSVKYRIRCSFDAAPFAWGMEDGVTNQDWIVPRNAHLSAPELRSEMYPGYLKEDEHHFEGKGIKHTNFEPYVVTHKGKILINEDTWIVSNPNGEKEVYLSEDFHQIYSLENV